MASLKTIWRRNRRTFSALISLAFFLIGGLVLFEGDLVKAVAIMIFGIGVGFFQNVLREGKIVC